MSGKIRHYLAVCLWLAWCDLPACDQHPACLNGKQMIHVDSTACAEASPDTKCSLSYFLQQVDVDCPDVHIQLEPNITYTLTDNDAGGESAIFNYTNMHTFSLTASGNTKERAVVECRQNKSKSAGLLLQGSHIVTLRNVVVQKCSFPILNYTTPCMNWSESNTDRTAFYIEYTDNVTIENVEVSNTDGVAVMLYSVNHIAVYNSTFQRNGLQQFIELAASGAVFLEVPHNQSQRCKPPGVNFDIAASPHLTVVNSDFVSNSADSMQSEGDYNVHKNDDMFQDNRGSGVQVYLRDNAKNAVIRVENCIFKNNTAIFGAGLSVYLQGNANNNSINLHENRFIDNKGVEYADDVGIESGGGAIQLMITNYPYEMSQHNGIHNNSFQVTNCFFEQNSAYFGGAVSIITASEDTLATTGSTNKILLENCTWSKNRARLGSAVDCVSWKELHSGILPSVHLRDNTFANNTVIYNEDAIAPIGGTGTIYTDRMSLHLDGYNTFVDNYGPGITAVDTLVHFNQRSLSNFTRNNATKGGGLCIYGHGRIVLYPHATLLFINNFAFLNGAAIYYRVSGPRNLMTSQNCFIQYYDLAVKPDNWDNVTMVFSCNNAKMDHSTIFASSILPCAWTGAPYGHGLMVNKTEAIQKALKYIPLGDDKCGNLRINTDALWANTSVLKHIVAYPGEKVNMMDAVRNEFRNATYSVFRGDSLDPGKGNLSDSNYISQMKLKFTGKPRQSFEIKLTSPWTLSFIIRSNVTLTPCAPGFAVDKMQNKCSCTANTKYPYAGIISCNSENAEMHPSYWAGYINPSKELCSEEEVLTDANCRLYTGFCALGHCNRNSLSNNSWFSTVQLPNKPTNKGLKDVICSGTNRRGILCSQCKRGYAPELNSYYVKCVPCNGSASAGDYVLGVFIWIGARLVPITAMVVVFLLFDIDILTGSMQCFIFYSQMLSYTSTMLEHYTPDPLKVAVQVSYMGYDIWKLRFGRYIYDTTRYGAPSLCLPFHNLSIATLEYLPGIFPFVIIYTLWFCKGLQERGYCCTPCYTLMRKIRVGIHRLRRQWSPNSTIIHGLVAFVVLSYTKFLLTSVKLVAPTRIMDSSGETDFDRYRVKFNGTLSYADGKHYPYLIVGILVLMTFTAIPPFILILIPLVPRKIIKLHPERKLKIVWLCDKLFSGPKWQFFLDAFQGGFKPKFSFFSGLFFLYRIIIIATYVLPTSPESQYFFHTVEVLIFLVIHALCQPYRRTIHNILDALIYTNLLVVLLLGNYLWQESSKSRKFSFEYLPYIILITMNLPQACFILHLIYRLFKAIQRIHIARKLRRNGKRRTIRNSSEERDLQLLNDSFQMRHEYKAFESTIQ